MATQTTVLSTLTGSCLVAALGFAAWINQADAQSPDPATFVSQDGIIALHLDGSETADAVALLDTKSRVMSVYHIDRSNGEVSLKSVRNVTWDLQLDEFNGVKPSPKEIKNLVPPR